MTKSNEQGILKVMIPAWALAATLITFAYAKPPIPPMPEHYVFDEPGLLTQQESHALSTLLIEHDQATGEQIVFAVFNSLEDQDLNTRTRELFDAWAVGQRVEDNGALLTLYLKEHKARIEVGLGLDPELPPGENQRIIREFLMPELRAGQPYRALGLSALELLRDVQSPLVESGRAMELLRAGGLEGRLIPVRIGLGTWFIWVILGVVFFAVALNNLAAAEAHFTSSGWFRPNPWRQMLQNITNLRHRTPRTQIGGADGKW